MTVPNVAEAGPRPGTGSGLTRTFRCMAVDITVQLLQSRGDAELLADRTERLFRAVESACTRFDPSSPLMRANAAGEDWYEVPEICYAALLEAERAHRRTRGRFDPRVLTELTALGYDRSLPFGSGPLEFAAPPSARTGAGPATGTTLRFRLPWSPRFDAERSAVRIGPVPVDLGGIGKGLAVRWAGEILRGQAEAFLIEAGGDLLTCGQGPEGDGWRAAVEDPRGGPAPVAVLDVTDRACATSSIRLRAWRVAGRQVHHLIDPRTGAPGWAGLLSVTVLGRDAADCEVTSKALFLEGKSTIAKAAATGNFAALWVDEDGHIESSAALGAALLWEAPDGH